MSLQPRPRIGFPGIIKGQKPVRIGMDFETFSRVDVTKVSADAYSRHASTEVLLCSFAVNNEAVEQWVPVEGELIPAKLEDAMLDERVIKTCWNKSFEWSIWKNTLGIETPHHVWRDTQALSYALALPGSLEKAGEVVDIAEDKKKSAAGRTLMRIFSSPRKPTKNKPWTRTHWHMEPEKWEEYKVYNIQDTEAERAILRKLLRFDMPPEEWELWVIDQIINARGIPINMAAVDAAIRLYEHIIGEYSDEMKEITGLANPNSGPQLLPWLQDRGYPYEDLKKGHVERAKAAAEREIEATAPHPDPDVLAAHRVLELRGDTSRSSVKKYYAIARCVDRIEGVLRNTFQFAGAGRTWRWAGRTFQPQNLPRPPRQYKKIIAMVVEHLERLTVEEIDLIYHDPMDLLVACIRAVAQAREGFLLYDADLNAIENRVLGWMAKDRKILRVFELGRDPYVDFATYMYHQLYDVLYAEYKGGDDAKRTIAKPAVLGCLGSDTLVLTDSGWKRIVDIRHTDKVHDGYRFVAHQGVVYRGERTLLCRSGVYATGDHKFNVAGDGWREWKDLVDDDQTFRSAVVTANGRLKRSFARGNRPDRFFGADARAALSEKYPEATWFTVNPNDARAALLPRDDTQPARGSDGSYSIFSQIVSTLREAGAKIPTIQLTNITGLGAFVCGSRTPSHGLPIALTSSARTENSKSTESTTTETTSPEIFASPHDPSRTSINGPSWDIVNAGTRQSFVVLTESGPVVAHNCGYQLGVGEERVNRKTGEIEATGLLGYARNMGIILTPEQAKHAVDTFRETYEEVVSFWRKIEKAAKRCVTTGRPVQLDMIRFEMKSPFLLMVLPSGRALHYCRPRIETVRTPWGAWREQLTYEGQNDQNHWVRIPTHGGKLTENADQAIARDILAGGLRRAYYRGLDIVMHVHDQIIGMAPEDEAEEHLRVLQECMAEEEDWHTHGNYRLPLASAGFTTKVFMKD